MNRFRPVSSSAAHLWAPLAPFIAAEAACGRAAERRGPVAAGLYEFLRFGVKQGWACLFGGLMVALLVGSFLFYPRDAMLARYDFLVLAAITIQVLLLWFRMETRQEAGVILIFHLVGTVMEVFKTSVGSWIYPEPSWLRIAGVPLFTGFMYAAIGSYLARIWRLLDLRFTHHPPLWAVLLLSAAIYVNFFTHHYGPDLRWLLFAATGLLFCRTTIYFKVWHVHRPMPLLVGFLLVALFIWFAENAGTFAQAWIYPSQRHGWSLVSLAKLGSWYLLMILSYALVAAVNRIAAPERIVASGLSALRLPHCAPESAKYGTVPPGPPR